MKKLLVITYLTLAVMLIPAQKAAAQIAVAEVIKAGVKKVIKAMDLRIQRLQNETIWLQNAQKTIENALSKLKLEEISDWTDRQKNLYKDYFEELNKVKSIIAYYHRIKEISTKQVRLVKSYQRAWQLLQQDNHFTAEELKYMSKVYGGILDESIRNIDQVFLVINSFQTQMNDAERLEIVRKAAEQTDRNYYDLQKFSQENILLSMSRAKESTEVDRLKKFYGLQ